MFSAWEGLNNDSVEEKNNNLFTLPSKVTNSHDA